MYKQKVKLLTVIVSYVLISQPLMATDNNKETQKEYQEKRSTNNNSTVSKEDTLYFFELQGPPLSVKYIKGGYDPVKGNKSDKK